MWRLEEKSRAGQGRLVAESAVHRSMKAIVRGELEKERYVVVEEPLYPPRRRASWSAYRPDLLGYRAEGGVEELVFVECETHPNMKRFTSKNYSSVWFQPHIFASGSVRRILAVPKGSLGRVDMRLRKDWEIWVLGTGRATQKCGVIADEATYDPRVTPGAH